MRKLLLAVIPLAVLLSGCSKKEGKTAETTGGAVGETSAKAGAGENPMIAAALGDIEQKLKANQLDAAVGSIAAMAGMPKSEAQHAAFMKQMRQTTDALNEKAQQGDVGAQQSVNMLGRMMTGR